MTTASPRPGADATPSADTALVIRLGLSQLVAWGALHYIIGVFGADIARSMGWSPVSVHGGFSVSLVVMGLSSRWVGERIDRHGGRRAMSMGFWIGAGGCLLLASSRDIVTFYLAWMVLGFAMRLSLYDAAFATLVKVKGVQSQQSMTVITLFGGLASTAFWPLGHALASIWGWRGALVAYAVILVVSSLLLRAIPRVAIVQDAARTGPASSEQVLPVPHEAAKTTAYGLGATLILFMQAGMAAHFIELLSRLGWAIGAVVAMSTMLGIGQLMGRLYMVFHGHRFPILWMNLLPPSLLLLSYGLYFHGDRSIVIAGAFALLYGAGNGISTITRGAVPVALFGAKGYGARVGRVLRPAFFASAAAPMAFAWTIAQWGSQATVSINVVFSAVLLGAAGALIHLDSKTRRSA
jgi:MFS family permease